MEDNMKKAAWFTGIVIVIFALIVGCYLLFFQEKNTKVPEGTFVRENTGLEGMWGAWQRSV